MISHDARVNGFAPGQAGEAVRSAGRDALGRALRESRADTLAVFGAFEAAAGGLRPRYAEHLNPPLWELGHIGWFQSRWIERNPGWRDGLRADTTRLHPPSRAGADALYDSSRVAHRSRWSLPLPGPDETRADLDAQLRATLQTLATAGDGDDALYFFRLALFHEDMHFEAGLYMAQATDVPATGLGRAPAPLPEPPPPLRFPAGRWRLGTSPGAGFAFDNELGAHAVGVGACEIDAQPVRWAEFLPFVESGGYADERWWDDAGRQWLRAGGAAGPRYLRRDGAAWLQRRHGHWQALEPREAACHLTRHEARAWCRWAGRRLPTEAEWEQAACTAGDAFRWGEVWEWTASPFGPYPGFVAHPYREYSLPWFDGRPVLRGASFMTQPRMRSPRYRNFFAAHRNDVPAGFRTCATKAV
jgi:ergothioneine biosynthesis protein EgtB